MYSLCTPSASSTGLLRPWDPLPHPGRPRPTPGFKLFLDDSRNNCFRGSGSGCGPWFQSASTINTIGLAQLLFFLFYFDRLTTLSLSTTLLGLSLALIIRLIALSNNSLDSGMEKIGKSIDDASRLIGRKSSTTYFRIILPQVKLSILAGFFLVFVDTVKELPITLLLRPFNFDTLATSLYEYSSNEMFEYGSLHALTIICFLSIVIYLFDNVLEKRMLSKTKK